MYIHIYINIDFSFEIKVIEKEAISNRDKKTIAKQNKNHHSCIIIEKTKFLYTRRRRRRKRENIFIFTVISYTYACIKQKGFFLKRKKPMLLPKNKSMTHTHTNAVISNREKTNKRREVDVRFEKSVPISQTDLWNACGERDVIN